jgi:predicted PurR-regulated permease PerM
VWQIRQVLLLVFAAVVLATVLNRVVRILQRWHVKRGIAVAIPVVLLLTLFGLFAIILPRLTGQIQQLSDALPQAIEQLRVAYEWLQSKIPGQVLTVDQPVEGLLQNLQVWASGLLGNFVVIVTHSVSVFLRLLLFIAATIMLLINPSQYRRVVILAFPAFYCSRVNEILNKCEVSLVKWIRGTLIAMATISVFSYVGLLILGVPLPLVNALIAGLLEFISNVGLTISVVPPALLALLDAPWKSLAVIGLYILIQQFESLVS